MIILPRILYDGKAPVRVINGELHELPFVVSFPHSGVCVPEDMALKLRSDAVLANMDWYLPELYGFLEQMGFTAAVNRISRYVIDPNRSLSDGRQDDYTKALVYEKTTFGRELYHTLPGPEEIQSRIRLFYGAYHQTLRDLIQEKQRFFDRVWLLDLHSFGGEAGADVVLGNNGGLTMNDGLTQHIRSLFSAHQFRCSLNRPFRGGQIVRQYGQAESRCEALQIELSYRVYIAEREFGEEELPEIDPRVMRNCRERLQLLFGELKNSLCPPCRR